MWSRPWRRRGKTAASRSMAGNHGDCGGQVIHSLPAAGLRGRLRSAMNNLGHGIMWSAEGNRASNTLTGADGLHNGRSFSRQNQPRNKDSVEIWRVCASAVDGLPLYWAILRFLVKGIWWRGCAASFRAGLFTIWNGARGERGRAREELKTVRPGAATRERFLEGEGEKRFGIAAGMACGVGSAHAAAAAGAGDASQPASKERLIGGFDR